MCPKSLHFRVLEERKKKLEMSRCGIDIIIIIIPKLFEQLLRNHVLHF